MWAFIVNPAAGGGRGKQVFERLQKSETYQSLDAVFYYTEYEGHAEELAGTISSQEEITAIVVVGGDGTIHEVINGLLRKDLPIGFIPGGSGNDSARGIGISGRPEEILKQMTDKGKTIDYFIGKYKMDEKEERFFVNSMGFGFDAATAHTANQSFYKKIFNRLGFGTGSYVIAVIQVLATFRPMQLEIVIDGEKQVYDGCLLLSVGNHPYYGGGMKMMPNAELQPDKFSVLLVHSVSKWKVLALFLTVFAGKHEDIKGVELLEASRLSIVLKKPIFTQVDGQTATCRRTEIEKRDDRVSILTYT